LIRGGQVLDGTGAAARPLDIRVRNGRITEMAPRLAPAGERAIDASGAIACPGFIDSHTHYDAAIHWDPLCDPMPQHGVTSVVIGNCSLGLAPLRAADRDDLADVLGYIEDIPVDTFRTAVPWSWETFGDYARALSARPLGVNVLSFVGHAQIRTWV